MKNRQIGKRLLCVFFCIASLFVFCIPASAEENPIPSMQEASAVYFYHIESDQIVGTKNETMQVSAGSSVKIMAGLIACERLAGHLQEEVMVTKSMVSGVVGHRLNLKSGDYLTVEHLLYSAVCSSYNDAFYVLAHTVSGSTEAFVELMNQKARELGLENTFFTDPSGIDDGSVTTANDVAKLALKAYENPLYLQMCGTERCAVKVSGESRTIYNRNAMIFSRDTTKYYNSSCIGMSAGSTTKGGHCVVSLTRKNNETYLCVVLGATETTDTEYGYVVANRLSDWAFRSYAYREILSPEKVVCTLPVTVSDLTSEVKVCTKESLSAYLPKGAEEEIEYSIRLMYSELEAPVEADTLVGYVAVFYQGRALGTLPLYTTEGAERSSIVSSLKAIKSLTTSRPVLAGLIFFVVAIAAWVTVETVITIRRRHRWDKYFSQKMELPPDLMRENHRRRP